MKSWGRNFSMCTNTLYVPWSKVAILGIFACIWLIFMGNVGKYIYMGVEPKIGVFSTPKMDGENNGKAYFLVDDLGVLWFLETPIYVAHFWACAPNYSRNASKQPSTPVEFQERMMYNMIHFIAQGIPCIHSVGVVIDKRICSPIVRFVRHSVQSYTEELPLKMMIWQRSWCSWRYRQLEFSWRYHNIPL